MQGKGRGKWEGGVISEHQLWWEGSNGYQNIKLNGHSSYISYPLLSSLCTALCGSPFIAVALKALPLHVLPFEQPPYIHLPHLLPFSVQFLSWQHLLFSFANRHAVFLLLISFLSIKYLGFPLVRDGQCNPPKQHLRALDLPVQSVTDWSKRPWRDAHIWLHRHLQCSSSDKMEEYHFYFPLLREFLHFICCPECRLTLLCTRHHHIYPQKRQIPQSSCIHTVSFGCRGLKIEGLDKIFDRLYFIHPCYIWDALHFVLWLPASKEVNIKEGKQAVYSDWNWTQLKLQFYTESW